MRERGGMVLDLSVSLLKLFRFRHRARLMLDYEVEVCLEGSLSCSDIVKGYLCMVSRWWWWRWCFFLLEFSFKEGYVCRFTKSPCGTDSGADSISTSNFEYLGPLSVASRRPADEMHSSSAACPINADIPNRFVCSAP